jgi:hypothetical protein
MTDERQDKRPRVPPERESGERGSHNEIGYRNVDEEAEHDERGSQGPGAGEPPPREQ